MRFKHRNPFEISDDEADDLVNELQSISVTEYPGPNYLKPLIQRTENMLPSGWGILWVPTSRSTGRFKSETGITLYYYKTIAIFKADDPITIRNLLHELWHARSMDTYGYPKYLENYMYWSELEADLYSMMVMYRDPLSPYHDKVNSLFGKYLSTIFVYGVKHFAKSLIRDNASINKIGIPYKWKFLIPFIQEAIDIRPDNWDDINWRVKLKYIPETVINNYTRLITQ